MKIRRILNSCLDCHSKIYKGEAQNNLSKKRRWISPFFNPSLKYLIIPDALLYKIYDVYEVPSYKSSWGDQILLQGKDSISTADFSGAFNHIHNSIQGRVL